MQTLPIKINARLSGGFPKKISVIVYIYIFQEIRRSNIRIRSNTKCSIMLKRFLFRTQIDSGKVWKTLCLLF